MGIGENIRLLRERYNITQEELAGIAGVTDKAVSFWEIGTYQPRMGAIEKIATHFGIQKSNIIEDGGMEFKTYTNNEDKILSHFNQLNPDGQERAIESVELLTHAPQYKKSAKIPAPSNAPIDESRHLKRIVRGGKDGNALEIITDEAQIKAEENLFDEL